MPDAQGNFVWLPAGPRTAAYAEAFGAAGLIGAAVRRRRRPATASGSPSGEPEANARVLEVAATLPR